MKQKIAANTRRRIEKITARLERDLGIGGWLEINHEFNEGGEEDAEATCAADWKYREATITWNLRSCASVDDEKITLTAVHEYVHALIDPVASQVGKKPLGSELIELSTESVARVIVQLLR